MSPTAVALKTLYAAACVGLGEHERAIALYRELLSGTPAGRRGCICRSAHAQKTLGQAPDGDRSPTARRPRAARDFGDAYWSLANLKTYRFTDAELAQMRAALAAPATALADRYHLCFALGKALEDRGRIRGVLPLLPARQ